MIRLIFAAIAILTSSAFGAPFQNGDFQTGYVEPTPVNPGDPRIEGWQVGGSSIFWDGSVRFPNPAPVQEWIEQTFDTTPGHVYRVVFGLWHEGDGGNPAAVRVDITSSAGQTLVAATNTIGNETGTVGFADMTHEFTATTSTTTLRFTHAYASDVMIRETRIDDVRVTDLSARPAVSTGLFPGVYIEGQVGRRYELQYTESVQPASWQTEGIFVLDTSPKLVLIQTNLIAPRRTYRAILAP